MKTLIFGAGPLGSLYAQILFEAGKDVTLLARGARLQFLREQGLVVEDGFTGERKVSPVPVVEHIAEEDAYDLVVVLIRKNKLGPVFPLLAGKPNLKNILFMGNNVLGFGDYLNAIEKEKMLFGFPGAGGSVKDQVARVVDRKSPNEKRLSITIGESDRQVRERTRSVAELFRSSGVPVDTVKDMDGWLKYHAAFVLPIAGGLYRHQGDTRALAADKELMYLFINACREAGRVLHRLGYTKRQPFVFNLFYWLPKFMTAKIFQKMFESPFAEIAFSLHVNAALDEMQTLAAEFRTLQQTASLSTPNLDRILGFI
jgi:2-dehydropantoate 2-reductase